MRFKRIFVLAINGLLAVAIVAFILNYIDSSAKSAPPATPTRIVLPNQPQLTETRRTQTAVSVPSLTFQSTSAPPTSTPTPAPIKTVHLAWFYKPPNSNDLPTLARYFEVFILTRLDEPARDSLRALGVRQPFLQYLRFDAIHDPGDCTKQPYRNQAALNPGDYCALTRDHPDWFLRDTRGSIIAGKNDGARYVFMDPGNAGWRAFWVQRAKQTQEQYAWDGIFLDNVEATRSKLERNGFTPARYPEDTAYQSAVDGFLAYISSNLRSRAKPLYANIIALENSPIWFQYLQYLDGVMEEAFAVDYGGEYFQVDEWEDALSRVEQAQTLGKDVILVAQGARADLPREQFAFASYLLVNFGRAAFRYADSQAYEDIWLYANYDVDLGVPLGPRHRSGNAWQRDFAKGSVIVDPAAHTATISTR